MPAGLNITSGHEIDLVEGRAAGEFVFTTAGGRPVRNVDYREDGWLPALKRATATRRKDDTAAPTSQRLTKTPRIHDLRTAHASWLIADNVPLTEIQHRIGHESIKTTSDTYGHLASDAQSRAAKVISVASPRPYQNWRLNSRSH